MGVETYFLKREKTFWDTDIGTKTKQNNFFSSKETCKNTSETQTLFYSWLFSEHDSICICEVLSLLTKTNYTFLT